MGIEGPVIGNRGAFAEDSGIRTLVFVRENQGKNKKKKLAAKEAKEAQAKASEEAKEE